MKEVTAETVGEFRDWFSKNHAKENKLFLVSWKRHTGKPAMSHREAMKEAICWGWIDTTVKRIDEDRYGRTFVKRNSKSRWSNATLSYARKMIREGRMQESGMKAFEEGKRKPVIDHGLPKNPDTPVDLKKALGKLAKDFESLAPSYRRYNIYWIEKAKRKETRKKRIAEVVGMVRDKIRAKRR